MNKVGKMVYNTDTNIIRNGKKQDNLHPVYTLVYLKAVIREFIDKVQKIFGLTISVRFVEKALEG